MATLAGDEMVVELERYINDLVFVKDNLDSQLYRFFSAADLPETLYNTGLYPLLNDIKHMLQVTGLENVYQARDVNRLFDLLFKKMPFSPLPVVGEATFTDLSVNPSLNHLESDELKEKQILELGKAAASKRSGWLKAEDLVIFGDFIVEEHVEKPLTDVRGIMQEAEFHDNWSNGDICFPIAFAELFPLVRRLASLPNEIDAAVEASHCRNTEQLTTVLSIAMAQVAGGRLEIRDWRLGPSFFDSMIALHLENDATAIRCLVDAIVDTVLRTNLAQTHHLRKNAGGNSPAQTDGEAVAWRRDIGHEYHLHYWEVRGECEIASVVVHGNMSIPRCAREHELN
ncbi:hypothetical protein [Burkholderia sp. Ac-20365]|uniref:hypothetical protein n=1 Tax=Burkholderia sp. Ac-20365 TaxID=2703897 RepID=UPI00197BBFC9|nr:hypothetical protein [Burkholderia sp. Ac-20365]MBN3759290.1 hypothetical protein [Burkholderia sp. Ac-20365]